MQKIKKNGQVTIPKAIREKVNLTDGDYITTELKDDCIVIRVIDIVHQVRKLQSA